MIVENWISAGHSCFVMPELSENKNGNISPRMRGVKSQMVYRTIPENFIPLKIKHDIFLSASTGATYGKSMISKRSLISMRSMIST